MDFQKAWHSCQNGPTLDDCLQRIWLGWRMCEWEEVGGESVGVLQGGMMADQVQGNLCVCVCVCVDLSK